MAKEDKYALIDSYELIEALGKVLDFDPRQVGSLQIVASVHKPVRITIEFYGDKRLLEYDWQRLSEYEDETE